LNLIRKGMSKTGSDLEVNRRKSITSSNEENIKTETTQNK